MVVKRRPRRTAKARRPARARAKSRPKARVKHRSKPRPKSRSKRAPARVLKGHVDVVGLGNLLQLLSMNKTEGVLAVARGGEKQSIHFGPEGIRLLSSTVPRVRRLSRLATKLSGRTLITPERLKN